MLIQATIDVARSRQEVFGFPTDQAILGRGYELRETARLSQITH